MRYHVLATDYDGTLAHNGVVDEPTIESLRRFIASGRQLIMVTGRELPELKTVFGNLDLFRWVVAENGGLLYEPSTDREHVVGAPISETLIQMMKSRGVGPISVGRSIVATWQPHEQTVLECIRELGLELQVIFNKGAVMILPAGVNKAFGLEKALAELKFSMHNVVGVGDAENDHSFLNRVGFSAAVANALPSLKASVDCTLEQDHGAAVTFLIEQMLADDLQTIQRRIKPSPISIANFEEETLTIPVYGGPVLICGSTGSGKSTLANRIVDVLLENKYQFCLIDPEGDYESLEGAVVLGSPRVAPQVEEVIHALEKPDTNMVVCLTGVPIPDRPAFFLQLMTGIVDLRARTGRPHWLMLDEAHHLLPADWLPTNDITNLNWSNTVFITVQSGLLPKAVIEQLSVIAVVGNEAIKTVHEFAQQRQCATPQIPFAALEDGEVLVWHVDRENECKRGKTIRSERQHHRHRRKYAEGTLPPDRSFFFRGAEGKLNLRAHNLMIFCQLAEGIDDETWNYHLDRGDYASWFLSGVKDEHLSAEANRIAGIENLSPPEKKEMMLGAIYQLYTLPTSNPIQIPGAS